MNKKILLLMSILFTASHSMGDKNHVLVTFHNQTHQDNISITISATDQTEELEPTELPEHESTTLPLIKGHKYKLNATVKRGAQALPITVRPNNMTASEHHHAYTITYNRHASGKLELIPGHLKQ